MTTVNEVSNDKTKVLNEFILRIDLHVSLLLKKYSCIRVCTRTIASVFLCFRLGSP